MFRRVNDENVPFAAGVAADVSQDLRSAVVDGVPWEVTELLPRATPEIAEAISVWLQARE